MQSILPKTRVLAFNTNTDIEKLKYPIGKFQKPLRIGKAEIEEWINIIEAFPKNLRSQVENLTEEELEKKYRPQGWSIRQVVNHCADSHMNSLIRFKLTLTEYTPRIKPYFENLWAELFDSKNGSIEGSLKILEGLHERWVCLMKNVNEGDLEKEFFNPESNKKISLKINIGIYAWHCQHHLAHVINAKQN